jgi:hypothetical protein
MSRIAWGRAVAAPVVALVLGGTVGSGCRSAGPARPQATGPARTDPLAGWVGETRILRHRGDQGKWSVKQQDLRSASGQCDVAVEVRQARFDRGTAAFTLETIGRPRLARRGARQERCADDQPQIAFSVSGFDAGASSANVEAGLAGVLQTPEAYLKANAVAFEAPAASGGTDAPLGDHHLTKKAARVLWVDAITKDPSGRVHHEAEVEFKAVVGRDGRLREPKLATGLSEEHEKRILRVLPLWRFEPARKGTDPASANVSERMVFRIY